MASVVLILLPLVFLRRQEAAPGAGYRARVVTYFTLVGLAYLLVEIAFIQKFILFLSHPLYAVAVMLAGFLVFSGLGSRYAGHRAGVGKRLPVLLVVCLLAFIGLVYTWALPSLFGRLIHLPDAAKVLVSLLILAPLAFGMGMPFSIGLAKVSAVAPALVPWAWGVNGCASLISAVLATLLAVHFGFTAVVVLAVSFYVLAGLASL